MFWDHKGLILIGLNLAQEGRGKILGDPKKLKRVIQNKKRGMLTKGFAFCMTGPTSRSNQTIHSPDLTISNYCSFP